jgi:hypothetical protein
VHAPFEQLLKSLTGRKVDPSTLNDASFDEDAALAAAAAEGEELPGPAAGNRGQEVIR